MNNESNNAKQAFYKRLRTQQKKEIDMAQKGDGGVQMPQFKK